MNEREFAGQADMLIIGAGIAGASAAISAARSFQGTRRVLLVDHAHWPREKACGCCLGPLGIASLQGLGFDVRARIDDAAPLSGVRLTARGGASCDLPHAGGVVVNRSVLDAALVRAAIDAGVTFRPACSASVKESHDGMWRVRLEHEEWVARTVIVADGLAGRSLASVPGFATQVARGALMGASLRMPASSARLDVAPEGIVQLVHGVGGYVGLVRFMDGSLDVAAALHPDRVRALGGPIDLMQCILDDARVRLTLDPRARVMGTPLLTRRRRALGGPGLIIAGDAAGYVEPFTGEGMTWAAIAGAHAGTLAASAINGDEQALGSLGRDWERWHRRELAPMQRKCRVIRLLLRTPGLLRGVTTMCGSSRLLQSMMGQISVRITWGAYLPGVQRARHASL